jgi:hypothetical protein
MHRTCPVDGIGIDDAIATVRHRVAGFDPCRLGGKRQRRIGRGADEIAGVQGPTVARCNIMRWKRLQRRHLGSDTAQGICKRHLLRRDRIEPIQKGPERHIKWGQRGRQALG